MSKPASYGTWTSPVSVDLIVGKTIGLVDTAVSSKYIYHSETRPSEGGRAVVVRTPKGETGKGEDAFGPGFNARSRVHEYGGGAFTIVPSSDLLFFSNFSDNRIYSVALDSTSATPVTTESSVLRYAAFVPHPEFDTHPFLLSVQEDHSKPAPADVVNRVVLVDTRSGEVKVVVEGRDFYSSPSWGSDGKIAFISWDHPNMPWESSELFLATLDLSTASLADVRKVAGGSDSSVCQSQFSSSHLYYCSDESGYTLLYRLPLSPSSTAELAMPPSNFDVAEGDWTFSLCRYALLSPTHALLSPVINGLSQFQLLNLSSKTLTPVPSPFVSMEQLRVVSENEVVFIGSANAEPSAVTVVEFEGEGQEATFRTVKASAVVDKKTIPDGIFSTPEGVLLDVSDGKGGSRTVNVLFYPPSNPNFEGVSGELPPCIVKAHGGPTGRASPGLQFPIAFYTSRGYGVLDVNYSGSQGFGRAYRQRLRGQWGVIDVEDCVEAVKGAAKKGLIDEKRVGIMGGSAGGFTVLAALCTAGDVFAAGISSYGIADLKLLADETHKFESHYLYALIGGTYSEIPEVYRARSPLFSASSIKAALLVLQGLDDKVVPPSQAGEIVERVQAAGGRAEVVYYEGEGHGFRDAKNIKDSLERSLTHFETTFKISL